VVERLIRYHAHPLHNTRRIVQCKMILKRKRSSFPMQGDPEKEFPKGNWTRH
jgi:hypothetical protein